MKEILDYIYQLPLLIGSIFIVTALITKIFPPKRINALYGYRTPKSIQNQETWNFAQKYSSNKMIQIGLFLVVISFLKIIIGSNFEVFFNFLFAFTAIIYLFVATEKALKNKFN